MKLMIYTNIDVATEVRCNCFTCVDLVCDSSQFENLPYFISYMKLAAFIFISFRPASVLFLWFLLQ